MKYLCFLLLSFFVVGNVNAQSCLPEGITFTTQEQIDNFQANYPGCTEIEGDVIIHDNAVGSISNLIGLNVITTFGGNLGIYVNNALFCFEGLENLTSIAGDFVIGSNPALTNLAG